MNRGLLGYLRSCIGWAVGIRSVVITSVLVLVREFEIGFCQTETSEKGIADVHCNLVFHGLQRIRRNRGMKYVHLVPARNYVSNADLTTPVRDRIVPGIQCDYHGAHLRVNVAEDVGDTGFVELDNLRTSTLIQTEIEALAVE